MAEKFMIHVFKERLPYVEHFLIPSMTEQGIERDDIKMFIDDGALGCLDACMTCFKEMDPTGDTWHMQDDIIISRSFKIDIEKVSDRPGIICGFCWQKDANRRIVGDVDDPFYKWWSFPCIRIPNAITVECGKWFYEYGKYTPECHIWVKQNRGDDAVFKMFLEDQYKNVPIYNLSPNLVDHVDFIIGGSIVNKERSKLEPESRAAYFEDRDLVEKLKKDWRVFQNK